MNALKWIIIIVFVLAWFYRRGKMELQRQEEAKRRAAKPPPTAVAQRPSDVADRTQDKRAAVVAALRAMGVDPNALTEPALAEIVKEDATDYDDEPEYDDVVAPAPKPYDETPPPAPYVPPPPPPPVVYAVADDGSSVAANAEVRRAIERASKVPPPLPHRPSRPDGDAAGTDVLVRDSVVMQMLLHRHPRNPMFYQHRPQGLTANSLGQVRKK